MSVQIPERCECGRCFAAGTPRPVLVRGLAEEWVRVERAWAVAVDATWEPWELGFVDALDALDLCHRIGHIPAVDPDELLALARDVALTAGELAATST